LQDLFALVMVENAAAQDDVIESCRRHDAAAQHRLFLMHKDRVYALAMYLSKNSADSAEIAQETFLKVFSDIGQFRGESKFETWLYRIVMNTARDHARRSRRFLFLDSAFWHDQRRREIFAAPTRVQSDIEETVRLAITSLPEKFRAPVVLRYIENLSYEQIAAVLNCPPGTIAAQLCRAHKMLASKLANLRRRR